MTRFKMRTVKKGPYWKSISIGKCMVARLPPYLKGRATLKLYWGGRDGLGTS